jgi:hypothetical protein
MGCRRVGNKFSLTTMADGIEDEKPWWKRIFISIGNFLKSIWEFIKGVF